MTIAAGFVHRDGVLLASDTLHEGYGYRIYESKIRHFNCPAGMVAFTYAGNAKAAIATIQKCKNEMRRFSQKDILAEVERIHAREYTAKILSLPTQSSDWNLHYQLLVAVRPLGGAAELYETDQLNFSPVTTYQCLGAGTSLARYLIKPTFVVGMPEDGVLRLAAYALAAAKDNAEGCGGSSLFLSLRNNGTLGELYSEPAAQHIEDSYKWFDFVAQHLFLHHLDLAVSDSDFEGNLGNFDREMRHMRHKWLALAKEQRRL